MTSILIFEPNGMSKEFKEWNISWDCLTQLIRSNGDDIDEDNKEDLKMKVAYYLYTVFGIDNIVMDTMKFRRYNKYINVRYKVCPVPFPLGFRNKELEEVYREGYKQMLEDIVSACPHLEKEILEHFENKKKIEIN